MARRLSLAADSRAIHNPTPGHPMQTLRLLELESRTVPTTFTVTSLADSGSGTLRAALAQADASPGKDTIVFKLPAPAAHSENVITLTSGELASRGDVTITGPGAGKLIISGNGASRIFDINDGDDSTLSPSTISGLSIINGVTTDYGGGVYSRESLTLKNVIISECTAGFGGAVGMAKGTAATFAMSNSFVADNSASDAGGLELKSLNTIALKKTIVTGNTALVNSGGIDAYVRPLGTGITITDCTIDENSAKSFGGMAVTNMATSPKAMTIITDTVIADNTESSGPSGAGGGAAVIGGNVVIYGSTIRGNSALYGGGGLLATFDSSLTVSRSIISGNRTTAVNGLFPLQGGGGMYISGNGGATLMPVLITGSSIIDNSSAYDGGGILATNGVAVTITGTMVAGNSATEDGGGIYASGTAKKEVNLTIMGGTVANDVAGGSGGGVLATGDGRILISSTKVTGNAAAGAGGGLSLSSSAVTNGVVLKNMTVDDNVANRSMVGGGVVLDSTPDFHILGGSFTSNAAGGGGAIGLVDSSGSILGTRITGNNAAVDGGGISQALGGSVVVQAADVFGNTALSDPDFFGMFTFI
jgi:predicted outer membrane repeat protein